MSLLSKSKSPQPKVAEALSKQEIHFLLKTLATSKFDGKDVLLLSGIIEKLSSALEAE